MDVNASYIHCTNNNYKKLHEKAQKDKMTHCYYQSGIEKDNEVNKEDTNAWLKQKISSHQEGFICAIQKQEVNTQDVQKKKRERSSKNSITSTPSAEYVTMLK